MQFVDNVTPKSGRDYWWQFEEISPRLLWNKRDEQTSRDYMSMYYQNAYNTALLNYQNEYNSPLQQMLRYQEAGLNPFLAQHDSGNMSGVPSGAAPRGSSAVTPTGTEIAGAVSSGINSVANVLRTAQGIYDYVKYGRPLQELDLQGTFYDVGKKMSDSERARFEALQSGQEEAFSRYWNTGEDSIVPGTDLHVSESPRSRYMEQSTQRISAQIEQLDALVNVLYPSQAQRNAAGTSLSMLQKQVLDGQKGAILSINTGNDTADAILKMVCFWLLNK